MPIRFSKPMNQVIGVLVVSGIAALSGCAPPLPETWQNDIPGVYRGELPGLREVIEFKADGTFHHQVFRNSKAIHSESGKWSVPPGDKKLVLEPFTEFYDAMARNFSAEGNRFGHYFFWPLPDGKSFRMISAGADYEFRLVRQESGSGKNHP